MKQQILILGTSLLLHSPSALLAFGYNPEEFSGGLSKYNIKNNTTRAPACGLNPVPGSLLRCLWLCWVEYQAFRSLLAKVVKWRDVRANLE